LYKKNENLYNRGCPYCSFSRTGLLIPFKGHFVDAIFTQPYVKVQHLVDRGIYAENTARSYLNELAELHILEIREIRGRHYYINPALVEILSY